MPNEETEMITLSEASKRIGVPTRTLRGAARRGDLKARLLGKTWVTTPAAVKAWKDDPAMHKPGPQLPGR